MTSLPYKGKQSFRHRWEFVSCYVSSRSSLPAPGECRAIRHHAWHVDTAALTYSDGEVRHRVATGLCGLPLRRTAIVCEAASAQAALRNEEARRSGLRVRRSCGKDRLKSAQELHEVLLFLRSQLSAANQVEEFHGVFQG